MLWIVTNKLKKSGLRRPETTTLLDLVQDESKRKTLSRPMPKVRKMATMLMGCQLRPRYIGSPKPLTMAITTVINPATPSNGFEVTQSVVLKKLNNSTF